MTRVVFSPIDAAINDLRSGKAIIVVDDESRENEGDLMVAAEFTSPEMINFMSREARGLICITLTDSIVGQLGLRLMVQDDNNHSEYQTPFMVSVEARTGVTTGISAFDRARTVEVLIDPNSSPDDLVMPGHMFPLKADPEGVLGRKGHTEAGVDLTRLAGLTPAAVICEIMDDDGTMARLPALQRFAAKHKLRIITIENLVNYLRGVRSKPIIEKVDTASLPTRYGEFKVTAYRDRQDHEHLLLRMGDEFKAPPLVRVHSECLTGDALGSIRCDCGEQLNFALDRIAKEGEGMLLYLRQEGRGIGLANKIKAYALQDNGLDTVEANVCLGFPPDQRDYAVAAAMLKDQGISSIRLLTNNPHKIQSLETNHIQVLERISNQVKERPENRKYLETKIERMNHLSVTVLAE